MSHTYAEGISFYYIKKEKFDKLLDQVKVISEEEYQEEAKDGFEGLVKYWNDAGTTRFNRKLISNESTIKYKK